MSVAREDAPMAHLVGHLRQWVVDFRPEAPNELIEMRRLGDFDRHVGAHLATIDVHIAQLHHARPWADVGHRLTRFVSRVATVLAAHG
jgi:hypothetical protein